MCIELCFASGKTWKLTILITLQIQNWHSVPSIAPGLTGHEALAERWILSRLNLAAKEINRSLEEYNFMVATSTVYNFWLYELCDVYVVSVLDMP